MNKKVFLLTIIFAINLILFTSHTFPAQAQSSGFIDLTAFTNTLSTGQEASFTISFKLPYNSPPINSNNFIIIQMPSYSNVIAPTTITGSYFGTPNISVNDTNIIITNINVTPGNQITIDGIRAITPSATELYLIRVLVSEDSNGLIMRNFGTTTPINSYGSVSATASIERPESRIVVSGYAPPGAFVMMSEDDSIIGTTYAGLNGYFQHIIVAYTPGDHYFLLNAIDQDNLNTSPTIYELYTPPYVETTLENIIFSPTITIPKSMYVIGEVIIASGSAAPNTDITLFTEAPLRTYSTTTNNLGKWSISITNTEEYFLGDYFMRALLQNDLGHTSPNSPTIGFSIVADTASSSGTPCGNIGHGNLNCDARIDLTDFSIIMYYWGTNNATADINQDSIVNLTDFSIMMYYWG